MIALKTLNGSIVFDPETQTEGSLPEILLKLPVTFYLSCHLVLRCDAKPFYCDAGETLGFAYLF